MSSVHALAPIDTRTKSKTKVLENIGIFSIFFHYDMSDVDTGRYAVKDRRKCRRYSPSVLYDLTSTNVTRVYVNYFSHLAFYHIPRVVVIFLAISFLNDSAEALIWTKSRCFLSAIILFMPI